MSCLNFCLLQETILLTYLAFLCMDILEIQLPRMNNNADIVLCQSLAEFYATRNCLLHECSSRPFLSKCYSWANRLLKILSVC